MSNFLSERFNFGDKASEGVVGAASAVAIANRAANFNDMGYPCDIETENHKKVAGPRPAFHPSRQAPLSGEMRSGPQTQTDDIQRS